MKYSNDPELAKLEFKARSNMVGLRLLLCYALSGAHLTCSCTVCSAKLIGGREEAAMLDGVERNSQVGKNPEG